jgi:hypothetical protein
MKGDWIWPKLLELVKLNTKPLGWSLTGGFAVSVFTGALQFMQQWPEGTTWFRSFGLPVAWMGIWKRSGELLNARFYFYGSPFLQNCLFWASVAFASIVVYLLLRGRLPLHMLPIYVVGLASARIQLELQMILATRRAFFGFAVDPFTYAQITAYFAMALLLFPVIVAPISRMRFAEIFRLSSLGFPIILMPPTVDYYVLKKPLIYNFFVSESFAHVTNPLMYFSVLSGGIKLEIALVASVAFGYLLYKTRSILRSAAAVLAVIVAFLLVSTPALTSRLNLTFVQPQYFAGFLILTYLLMIASFGIAHPNMARTIVKRMRLRGIHFPAMTLFGAFLVHPAILSTRFREDYGLVVAGTFIVFLVWQTATVFDDIYDRGEKPTAAYLCYGMLTALMAPLAAIPFGLWPLLLTLLAVYLALDYPRLRRKHFLMSGIVIGASTCAAFLFGALIPISGQPSSQPIGAIALAMFAVFSGGSLLKDITSVKQDTQAGIPNIFTRFDVDKALPAVATFVAAGMMLPAVFLRTPLDLLVFLATGVGSWLLIVLAKDHCYKPVLVLYFLEGAWVFLQMFVK